MVTMMPIGLGKGLITTHSTNTVLDDNPPLGEGRVVEHIVRRSGLSARLSTGCCACAELVDTHISQIADAAHALRQAVHQGRMCQDRHVGSWPSDTVSDIHDLARFLIDSDLAFKRVGLFRARIELIGLGFVAWTLDPLLKSVDDHRQLWRVVQQVIQLAAAFATWIGQPHRVSARSFQHRQHPLNGAACCTVAHPEQIAQHLLRRVHPQPYNGQQNMVSVTERKGMSCPDVPFPSWSTQSYSLRLCVLRQYILYQFIKLAQVQARHGSKNVRMVTQVQISHHHAFELTRDLSLIAKVIY